MNVRVKWETIGGDVYAGKVVDVDNGTVIVDCDDGKQRATTIDGCKLDEKREAV